MTFPERHLFNERHIDTGIWVFGWGRFVVLETGPFLDLLVLDLAHRLDGGDHSIKIFFEYPHCQTGPLGPVLRRGEYLVELAAANGNERLQFLHPL